MKEVRQKDEYNSGWDSGYEVGHKDGQLIYLDILRTVEEIRDVLTKIEDVLQNK